MNDADVEQSFERVDWDAVSAAPTRLTAERLFVAVGLSAVLALVLYNRYFVNVYIVGNWNADPIDWVVLSGLVVLGAVVVVPVLRGHRFVGHVLGYLRSNPLVALAAMFLFVLVLVGAFGQFLYRDPGLRFDLEYLPPVGATAEHNRIACPGTVSGDAFNRRCHGSWSYPLGTNHRGHPLGFLLVEGARVALSVIVVTLAFVVPVAIATGVVAGTYGGLVDDALMTLVTIQLSIPAIVVYFVGFVLFRPSMVLLLAVFGLLSWGAIARLVRSETIKQREAGHVQIARSLGASQSYIARRHLLPNVTNTVVPAVFQLCALLVLVEAGIAFLGFHDIELYSWGATISDSVNAQIGGRLQNRVDRPAYQVWWVSTLPALALTATLLSFKLLGDGLRDVLDPKGR